MLNADDAMHVMEHVATINSVHASNASANNESHKTVMNEYHRQIELNVRAQKELIKKLTFERNDSKIALSASGRTIEFLAAEIARLKNIPVEVVQGAADIFRSKKYDELTDENLSSGVLSSDPRKDPEIMEKRHWYVSSIESK